MTKPASILLIVVAFIALFTFSAARPDGEEHRARDFDRYHGLDSDRPVTREEILDNMDKRKLQLEVMLEKSKTMLKEHRDGTQVMEKEEMETVQRRISLIEGKLENWVEPDEHKIELMRQREQRRQERRRGHRSEL